MFAFTWKKSKITQTHSKIITTFGVEFFDGVSSVVQREKPKKKGPGATIKYRYFKELKKVVFCRLPCYGVLRTVFFHAFFLELQHAHGRPPST